MKTLLIFLVLNFSTTAFAQLTGIGDREKAQSETAYSEAARNNTILKQMSMELDAMLNSCQGLIQTATPVVPLQAYGEAPVCPNVNTCINNITTAIRNLQNKITESGESCNRIAKTAQISCEASTYAPYVTLVTGQLGGSSSGSMYDKCKKAATLQLGMSTISAGLAGTCMFSKKKCENGCASLGEALDLAETKIQQAIGLLNANREKISAACPASSQAPVVGVFTSLDNAVAAYNQATTKIRSSVGSCEKYELNVMSALMSATQLVQGIAQSQSCQKELAQDECTKPEATQNPACTAAYCSVAANQSAPQCVAIFGECYSANAAANPKCACLQNPMQQSCLNLPTVDINTPNRNTASNVDNSGYNFDEDDLYGAQGDSLGLGDPNAKAPGVSGGGQQGGGGGGAGSGTPLGGGPGGGGGGSQKGVYDTNVTGGTSAGGGGGGSGGGIAGYGSGANTGYGTGGAGGMNFGKSSLDLKKYLPGGQLAKQRDEQDTGITSANGLSNFQKVNRAHNKSRGQLVNP